MNSIYHTRRAEETMALAQQLAPRLKPGSVILLYGDLGSGKTHFSKGLAQGLGIEAVIKSPTFTYVNSYKIPSEERGAKSVEQKKLTAHRSPLTANFYHYDLYRLQPGDSFHSIGLEDTLNDPHGINLIEWADRLGENLPKNYIRIDFVAQAEFHEIQIQFFDSEVVPEALVEHFWEAWATPLHVRAHCKQVAQVAVQMGEAFTRKNILIDLNSLHTAALLHDMARICDFKTMERTNFCEEITEEKWEKWLILREKYAGRDHPDLAFEALSKKGYLKTAELIRLHNSLSILEEPEQFEHLETALLYYADKRVKHDEVVSLAERFRDGEVRYGNHDDARQKELYGEVEKRTFELEGRLFERIDLKPEEIQ